MRGEGAEMGGGDVRTWTDTGQAEVRAHEELAAAAELLHAPHKGGARGEVLHRACRGLAGKHDQAWSGRCPAAKEDEEDGEEKEDEESGVRPLHSVYFDIPRAMSLDRRYGHILLHVPPLIVLRSSLRIMPFIFT